MAKFKFSLKLMKSLLSESAIEMNQSWQTVLELSGPTYFENRALLNITEMNQLMAKTDKSMEDYHRYDALSVNVIQILTLARMVRGSYHVQKEGEYIVIQTELGLKKGEVRSKNFVSNKEVDLSGTQKDRQGQS